MNVVNDAKIIVYKFAPFLSGFVVSRESLCSIFVPKLHHVDGRLSLLILHSQVCAVENQRFDNSVSTESDSIVHWSVAFDSH